MCARRINCRDGGHAAGPRRWHTPNATFVRSTFVLERAAPPAHVLAGTLTTWRGFTTVGYKRVARITETNPPEVGGLTNRLPVDEVDLHRLKVGQARRRAGDFLRSAARQHPGQIVRIITGRGRHSVGGAKLGPAVEDELSRLTSLITEWRLSPDGGSYLVRLR